MNRYTVLLLLPDFVADTYGIDTYTAHVVAHDPCRAVRVAQVDAVTEHHDYNPDPVSEMRGRDIYLDVFDTEDEAEQFRQEQLADL